jgi:hypothetical protein
MSTSPPPVIPLHPTIRPFSQYGLERELQPDPSRIEAIFLNLAWVGAGGDILFSPRPSQAVSLVLVNVR